MRFKKKKAPQRSVYIERRFIVEALEKAQAARDAAGVEAALHLLHAIDEKPL